MNPELQKLNNYETGRRLIVRDNADSTYPATDGSSQFSWCRTNFYAVSDSEIELLLGFETAIIDQAGYWKILQSEDEDFGQDKSKFHRIKIKRIGRINGSSVTRIDRKGDEYYMEPHVFIETPDHGEWFAPFSYRRNSNEGTLDPTNRL